LGTAAINFGAVSKDDGRDPGFVKPLGADSASTTAAWRPKFLRLRLRGQASIVSAAVRELISAV
jgi:hypothetical protein